MCANSTGWFIWSCSASEKSTQCHTHIHLKVRIRNRIDFEFNIRSFVRSLIERCATSRETQTKNNSSAEFVVVGRQMDKMCPSNGWKRNSKGKRIDLDTTHTHPSVGGSASMITKLSFHFFICRRVAELPGCDFYVVTLWYARWWAHSAHFHLSTTTTTPTPTTTTIILFIA